MREFFFLKWNLKEQGVKGVDWIHLAEDMNRWWDAVNLRVS
jgi:hypothetical protein